MAHPDRARVGEPDVVDLPGPWRHRQVSANGIQLHTVEAGEGPLLLLLHGFPEFWWSWRHQLRALAADHHVVACDLRGYGGSDRPPRGYDLWTLAGDVAGLIRALGRRHADVVGAGWGAAVGWTLAALHPVAVRRLAALATPHPLALRRELRRRPWRHRHALRPILAAQLPFRPERTLLADGAAHVGSVLRAGGRWPGTAPDELDDVVARHRAAMAVPRVPHTSTEYFRWAVRSQFRPDGERFATALDRPIEAPVLALHGGADPWVPAEIVRASARWCADPTVRELPGVGHFPHQEAPAAVSAALAAFLG